MAYRHPGHTVATRDPMPADAAEGITALQIAAVVVTLAVAFFAGFAAAIVV